MQVMNQLQLCGREDLMVHSEVLELSHEFYHKVIKVSHDVYHKETALEQQTNPGKFHVTQLGRQATWCILLLCNVNLIKWEFIKN